MFHHPVLFTVIAYVIVCVLMLIFNHGAAADKSTDHNDP